MSDSESYHRKIKLRSLVERVIAEVLKSAENEAPRVEGHLYYGAIGINPKHLQIWYIFKTDCEKEESRCSGQMKRLSNGTLGRLAELGYPVDGLNDDNVAFASEEEIERGGGRAFFQ